MFKLSSDIFFNFLYFHFLLFTFKGTFYFLTPILTLPDRASLGVEQLRYLLWDCTPILLIVLLLPFPRLLGVMVNNSLNSEPTLLLHMAFPACPIDVTYKDSGIHFLRADYQIQREPDLNLMKSNLIVLRSKLTTIIYL